MIKINFGGKEFALGYNFQVKIYRREKSSKNSRQELKQRLWRNEADLIVFHDFVKTLAYLTQGNLPKHYTAPLWTGSI